MRVFRGNTERRLYYRSQYRYWLLGRHSKGVEVGNIQVIRRTSERCSSRMKNKQNIALGIAHICFQKSGFG